MSEPQMRAHHLQSSLEAVDVLGPEVTADVHSRVSPSTLETIRRAPHDWLPIALDVELTEAIAAVIGIEGVRRWSHDALARSLDKPFMSPLLGALRVFGVTPAGYTKLGPRGWAGIYRDAGALVREQTGPSEVLLTHVDVPPVVMASEATHEGTAGAFEVVLKACRVAGEVRLSRGVDEVRYIMSWRPS